VDRPDRERGSSERGPEAQLVVFLGGAPGAGKTHRLLTEAVELQRAGRRVAVGWIETKGRPSLDELAAQLPRIPLRDFDGQPDFDLGAAFASDYDTFVLDELAHTNPPGAPSQTRWLDALALRAADRSVLGAFDVEHLSSVVAEAARIVEHPIGEIVPLWFLHDAEAVVAIDVSTGLLESRLKTGRIVRPEDVAQARADIAKPQRLATLRGLLMRTVDELTSPTIEAARVSIALAVVVPGFEPERYLRRVAVLAEALDLAVEATAVGALDDAALDRTISLLGASRIDAPEELERGRLEHVSAALVAVPAIESIVESILDRPVDRDVFIADPARAPLRRGLDDAHHPYGMALGDRQKIGYGELTIYLGAASGSGKTYAMLDRGQQLREEGVDLVAALVDPSGRPETAAKVEGLEIVPAVDGEVDVAAVLARRPHVALVDDLGHASTAGDTPRKRYDDVLALVRGGVSVMTTLDVGDLAGLGDVIERLTGARATRAVPDTILEVADDLLFVDVAPAVLLRRVVEGKVFPRERAEAELASGYRIEILKALRELAVREIRHARMRERRMRPFDRIVLGVSARERDLALVPRVGRLAERLGSEFCVVHVGREDEPEPALLARFAAEATAVGASFGFERAHDAAVRLAAIAGPADAIAVESPRRKRSAFGRRSMASRLVRAGVRDLLVLAPTLV